MTKSQADQLARDTVLTGSAGIGASGALSAGKGGPLSGSADLKAGLDGRSSDTRRTDQGVSTSTQNTDAHQWLEKESNSEAAHQARESNTEDRSGGKECGSTVRSRWTPDPKKKKQ